MTNSNYNLQESLWQKLQFRFIMKKKWIRNFDSLKGFASLAVVISNCLIGYHFPNFIDITPLYFLKAAHEAVIFFFVLNGYVLVCQYSFKTFVFKNF